MTTLRDRVRSALGRTEPTPDEARADLERILARAPPPRRLSSGVLALVYAATAAVLLVFLLRSPRPGPPRARTSDVHLYLHVRGEPDDQALALDLSSTGAK